ncbi:hypothetical protein C2W62_01160 [Candidatus Entotheonella serta]|nr:hypothetical protein C2W62_01160 [Candidatus Entotheonella serta]
MNHRAPVQAQREIINVRDPAAAANIRAMSPHRLKAHVDRAIEQNSYEHIRNIKVVSSHQFKSGDFSLKAATSADIKALKQFAVRTENRQRHQGAHPDVRRSSAR